MDEKRAIKELGNCVRMILLNNRMYREGRISDEMRKKISAEILSEHQRKRGL